jgi:predicted PurR-regulated permease PerM
MMTYFLIGLVLMIALELLVDYLEHVRGISDVRKDLKLSGRIMCVLIWPIGLLVFLIGFIKTKFKK